MYIWYTPRTAKQLCFHHEIDGEPQGEKNKCCDFGKKIYSDFESPNAGRLIENTFLEWKEYG